MILASPYFLGCLLRTKEKYTRPKAASNTPPNIKIKVVTICSPISISKKSLVGVQLLICSPKTRRGGCRQTSPHRPNYCGGWRSNKKRVERRGLAARELGQNHWCCSLATSLTGYMCMPSESCKTAHNALSLTAIDIATGCIIFFIGAVLFSRLFFRLGLRDRLLSFRNTGDAM